MERIIGGFVVTVSLYIAFLLCFAFAMSATLPQFSLHNLLYTKILLLGLMIFVIVYLPFCLGTYLIKSDIVRTTQTIKGSRGKVIYILVIYICTCLVGFSVYLYYEGAKKANDVESSVEYVEIDEAKYKVLHISNQHCLLERENSPNGRRILRLEALEGINLSFAEDSVVH